MKINNPIIKKELVEDLYMKIYLRSPYNKCSWMDVIGEMKRPLNLSPQEAMYSFIKHKANIGQLNQIYNILKKYA